MNEQERVEYIAEIAQLKRELKKSHLYINKEMPSSNKELLIVANQCIEQISKNTGNKAYVTLNEHKTIPLQSGITERHYHLTAELIDITKI